MLSFVLPLLGLAIALTPVVISARETYQQEIEERNDCSEAIDLASVEVHNQVA